jgi:hypothetical protein
MCKLSGVSHTLLSGMLPSIFSIIAFVFPVNVTSGEVFILYCDFLHDLYI